MNAGSTESALRLVLAVVLGALACDRLVVDPPPPPSRHEVPAAPPGALGAHAASNTAASRAVERGSASPDTSEPEPEEETVPRPDAGSEADSHPPEPEGVAL